MAKKLQSMTMEELQEHQKELENELAERQKKQDEKILKVVKEIFGSITDVKVFEKKLKISLNSARLGELVLKNFGTNENYNFYKERIEYAGEAWQRHCERQNNDNTNLTA